MKIMILSDSHSMTKTNLLLLLEHQTVDYYIHCGDIYMPYDDLFLNNFYIVRGNNDYNNTPKEITITLDNKTFFVTHGHTYDVDFTISNLLEKGLAINADVICYGHTHAPLVEKEAGILVINPGSVRYPRGLYRRTTYCILDTDTMEVEFYDAHTHAICKPFVKEEETVSRFKHFFK